MRLTVNEQQDIDQVAGIIHDNLIHGLAAYDPDLDILALARELNAEGWTYEIRYHPTSRNYVNDRDYTRVEGLTLADDDLMAAYKLAVGWAR